MPQPCIGSRHINTKHTHTTHHNTTMDTNDTANTTAPTNSIFEYARAIVCMPSNLLHCLFPQTLFEHYLLTVRSGLDSLDNLDNLDNLDTKMSHAMQQLEYCTHNSQRLDDGLAKLQLQPNAENINKFKQLVDLELYAFQPLKYASIGNIAAQLTIVPTVLAACGWSNRPYVAKRFSTSRLGRFTGFIGRHSLNMQYLVVVSNMLNWSRLMTMKSNK